VVVKVIVVDSYLVIHIFIHMLLSSLWLSSLSPFHLLPSEMSANERSIFAATGARQTAEVRTKFHSVSGRRRKTRNSEPFSVKCRRNYDTTKRYNKT